MLSPNVTNSNNVRNVNSSGNLNNNNASHTLGVSPDCVYSQFRVSYLVEISATQARNYYPVLLNGRRIKSVDVICHRLAIITIHNDQKLFNLEAYE